MVNDQLYGDTWHLIHISISNIIYKLIISKPSNKLWTTFWHMSICWRELYGDMWQMEKPNDYLFKWQCFIGISLCKMGILVIIIVTIWESFRIIIPYRSNFILESFLFCILSMFLFICIFLWIYLMNWTFIDILLTKSRMKKILMEQNDI
jgi:hypothetical protein